jgi:hypothetical protein
MMGPMTRQRFLLIWSTFSFLYLLLAGLGPGGLLPTGRWPLVNQHLLQVRAWRGVDIIAPAAGGAGDEIIAVDPRLDVTPYFRHWVVEDSRERVLLSNLAVAIEGEQPGEPLRPIRYVEADSVLGRLQMQRMVCHVGSPLGPAFLLLPIDAVLGGAVATQWVGALLGGLAVALMDLLLLWWLETVRGAGSISRAERGRLLVLVGAGTLWIWLVPQGEVWMFAQTVATCMLSLAFVLGWRGRWLLAGLAFGLAVTSRPPTLFALPLLLALVMSRVHGLEIDAVRVRRLRALAAAAVFPLLLLGAQLTLNWARFSSPLEAGYSFMLTPPELRQRLESHGPFSVSYLGTNARYLLLQPPVEVRDPESDGLRFPFLASDPMGMGVFFVTPAFLAVFLTFAGNWRGRGLLAACWVSLVLVTAPALLYFNTGWVQWGGRYLLDAWPLWLMLTALGLRRMNPRVAWCVVLLSAVSNTWAVVLATGGWWP